jgi:acetamidase/formamidase
MALFQVEPTQQDTVNHFSAAHDPVVTVDPGDTVVVRTLDAFGYLERHEYPGDEDKPKMFPGPFQGHCLNRPIAVRGARPGDTLAVRIVSVTPADWGVTVAPAGPDSPVARRLGLADAKPAWLLWEIDAAAGTATANGRYTRPLAPFLGVTGTAPGEPGRHSTYAPFPGSGGNIDCKELVAGSTLYLPVNTDGALLYLGDGHAAQGDGESCGTAIECGMTTEVTVSVASARPVTTIHAETPAGLVTFGFSADLNQAMGDALDAMVGWLAAIYQVPRTEALALASTCVDLRVTQVANGTWGIHALLPHGLLR